MSELDSQGAALVRGVNAFAPLIERMATEEKDGQQLADWPTVLLTQLMQTTMVSLFSLLPPMGDVGGGALLDRRSIATLCRNVIDTHDVIAMMVGATGDKFYFNRLILGHYIAAQISRVQTAIDREAAQRFYPEAQAKYWERIQASPLYDKERMARLKKGETVFYKSRSERLSESCGQHDKFVSGVVADYSTHVHSVPPAMWFDATAFDDTPANRNVIAVWLRVTNFFYARAIRTVLRRLDWMSSDELTVFLDHHREVFSG
jgi:hypothetical protein